MVHSVPPLDQGNTAWDTRGAATIPHGSARPSIASGGGNDHPPRQPAAAPAVSSDVEVSERGGLLASDSPLVAIAPPLEQALSFDVAAAQAATVAAVRPSRQFFVSLTLSASTALTRGACRL